MKIDRMQRQALEALAAKWMKAAEDQRKQDDDRVWSGGFGASSYDSRRDCANELLGLLNERGATARPVDALHVVTSLANYSETNGADNAAMLRAASAAVAELIAASRGMVAASYESVEANWGARHRLIAALAAFPGPPA